jgi:hypothetical protein
MIEDIIIVVASKLEWILENYSSDESEYTIYCKDSKSGKEIEIVRSGHDSKCAIFPDKYEWDLEIDYSYDCPEDLRYLTIDQAQTILKLDTFEIRYEE